MQRRLLGLLLIIVFLVACAPAAPTATAEVTPSPSPTPVPPTTTPTLPSIYLRELEPVYAHAAGGNFCIGREPVGDPVKCTGRTLQRDGTSYPNSIFAHANSAVEFDLSGEYGTLSFSPLILGPNCGDGVVFSVLLDGQEVYKSPVIKRETNPQEVEVDVTGGRALILQVDQLTNLECDWSTWGEPQLVLSEPKTAVPQPTPSGPIEPPVNPFQPLPGPRLPITAENIHALEPLAYIGEGTLVEIVSLPDPALVALIYSTGIEVLDRDTEQVVAKYPISLPPTNQQTYIYRTSDDGQYFLYTRPSETVIVDLTDGSELLLDYEAASLSFSPDGVYILLTSEDQRTTQLITLGTGEVHEFREPIAASSFSEDGQHLVIATSWVATAYTLPDLQQNGSITSSRRIEGVEILSSGVLLFITENNLRSYVYPGLQQLGDVSDPSGFFGFLGDIELSEDESLLLVRSRTDTSQFRIWDIATMKPLATMKDQYQVTLSPDNKTAISRGRDGVILWDLETDSRLLTLPASSSYTFSYSETGDHVIVYSTFDAFIVNTRTQAVEDLSNSRVLRATPTNIIYLHNNRLVIRNHSGTQQQSASAPGFDGRALSNAGMVAVWGGANYIGLYDAQSADYIGRLPMRTPLDMILQDRQSLAGWDLDADLKAKLNALAFSSIGSRPEYSGDLTYRINDNRVIFYEKLTNGNFNENSPLFELIIPEYIRDRVTREIYVQATAIDPINNLFYLTAAGGGRQVMVRAYNLETRSVVREYLYEAMKEQGPYLYYCDYANFSLSHDYTRLALIDENCNIQVVDTASWRTLYAVDAGPPLSNHYIGFSPDNSLLVTVFNGDLVNIWNAENGELLKSLHPMGGYPDNKPYVNFAFLDDAFGLYHGGQYSIWGVLEE
ncbi:MAG: NPCBM/NEW2 domain-containing protein [Anaerolineales bacterium]|nr:NPCBM/NEW2 domain-containing protein [Anaerolineales bacterium]